MFKSVRSAFRGLLVVTSFVGISVANAQANLAAIANNPLAQGYSSDIGYGSSNNGPLDGNTGGGYDFHSAAKSPSAPHRCVSGMNRGPWGSRRLENT